MDSSHLLDLLRLLGLVALPLGVAWWARSERSSPSASTDQPSAGRELYP